MDYTEFKAFNVLARVHHEKEFGDWFGYSEEMEKAMFEAFNAESECNGFTWPEYLEG